MLDRKRILGKIDELEAYLGELAAIAPVNFKVYRQKKMTCLLNCSKKIYYPNK